MRVITQAQFAEKLCYLSSHISGWAGSCLTLPEYYDKPMRASSVERFIREIQDRLDWLKEDLARLQELEGSGPNLADAHSISPYTEESKGHVALRKKEG